MTICWTLLTLILICILLITDGVTATYLPSKCLSKILAHCSVRVRYSLYPEYKPIVII